MRFLYACGTVAELVRHETFMQKRIYPYMFLYELFWVLLLRGVSFLRLVKFSFDNLHFAVILLVKMKWFENF
jgi:hypothetical protein